MNKPELRTSRSILPTDFDFTQGNLQDYADCPYRFYLRYIKRVKWPALIVDDAAQFEQRMQAGAAFHRLIQQYLVGIPETRLSEMVDFAIEQSSSPPELNEWWDSFLSFAHSAHVHPLLDGQKYVETSLACSLAGQRLVAKYDLILVTPEGELTIFDWKTSQKAPRVDWLLERMQTRLYCYILAEASSTFVNEQMNTEHPFEPEQISMNYWYVSQPGTPVTLPYSHKAYEQDQAHLTRMIKTIAEHRTSSSEHLTSSPASFQRTDDLQHCRYCVYRSHCDRGVEAGSLSEWEGEDYGFDSSTTRPELSFDDIPEIKF